ncbi:protein of unknown function DUF464 [Alkaliphilus metalliredigens QYMF]|uniref:Ribosomal processing cysteine protease Prp n=1 Tax=Alkaliphilus metalliredigens (strain QYMF) TaxID=293826 RepID=A6TQJ3_ALKMQ|nr:ribosomal-processing cysteine protease Prp [Alkaliphilus metalliredigens]ABR48461.1 protein of unknown function DUF464 [Alkaliphilus metalliredigens QYMF]
MIHIRVNRNKKNDISTFEVKGHANSAHYGEDVVCAAISVLSQTTVLGLHDIVGINVEYKIQDGYLFCKMPEQLSDNEKVKSDVLIETMLLGIANIKETYPSYIEIYDKEV